MKDNRSKAARWVGGAGLACWFAVLVACQGCSAPDQAAVRAPVFGYEIVAEHPHDVRAFTQGLFFHDGYLYEGTGKYGRSSLRKVEIETGKVVAKVDLEQRYFGEGVTRVGNRIVQLTWRGRKGFLYDLNTLERVGEFRYSGEGWGITTAEDRLVMSDGSSYLRFLDLETFEEVGSVRVREGGQPVRDELNELEYIDGEIWANSWNTDQIVRIDPATGSVTARVDLSGLGEKPSDPMLEAVLNGVAWDSESGRIWVTGKLWPSLFEIRVR